MLAEQRWLVQGTVQVREGSDQDAVAAVAETLLALGHSVFSDLARDPQVWGERLRFARLVVAAGSAGSAEAQVVRQIHIALSEVGVAAQVRIELVQPLVPRQRLSPAEV